MNVDTQHFGHIRQTLRLRLYFVIALLRKGYLSFLQSFGWPLILLFVCQHSFAPVYYWHMMFLRSNDYMSSVAKILISKVRRDVFGKTAWWESHTYFLDTSSFIPCIPQLAHHRKQSTLSINASLTMPTRIGIIIHRLFDRHALLHSYPNERWKWSALQKKDNRCRVSAGSKTFAVTFLEEFGHLCGREMRCLMTTAKWRK